MNLFDPVSVSEAHQRALMVEKHTRRNSGSGFSTGSSINTGGDSKAVGNQFSNSNRSGNGNFGRGASGSTMNCFACCEPGKGSLNVKRLGKEHY